MWNTWGVAVAATAGAVSDGVAEPEEGSGEGVAEPEAGS
jgi:hypothetical protein